MWQIFKCVFLLKHRKENGESVDIGKGCTTIGYVRLELLGSVKIVDYVSVAEGSKLMTCSGTTNLLNRGIKVALRGIL